MKCSEMKCNVLTNRCIDKLNNEIDVINILNNRRKLNQDELKYSVREGWDEIYGTNYIKYYDVDCGLDYLNLYDEVTFGYIEGDIHTAIRISIYEATATLLYKLFGKDIHINKTVLSELSKIRRLRKGFKHPAVVHISSWNGPGYLTSYLIEKHGDVLLFTKLEAPFRFTTTFVKIDDIKENYNVLHNVFRHMIDTAYYSRSFYEEFDDLNEDENKEVENEKYEIYCKMLKDDLLPTSDEEVKRLYEIIDDYNNPKW